MKKPKNIEFNSVFMVKIYVIQLACFIEQLNYQQLTQGQSEQLRVKAHALLEEIPILVKNKQQHQFTIIELLLKYKEGRAFVKLKDLDFISYKLFKLER